MTSQVIETEVLIVGAGPVGLTMAIDLGQRGVACVVVERREAPLRLPKMERCNARSMEIYRRLGLADAIRSRSFPEDARMDIGVMTTMAEPPLVRLEYPTVAQSREAAAVSHDGTLPLEPYQVVSQYTLEPLLRDAAEELDPVTVRFGAELVEFAQDENGVVAEVDGPDGRVEIHAAFLVGCDGGRSTVRKQLDIGLEGDGGIARRNQVFFRCDDFFDLVPSEQGRMYFFANEDESVITVQDDLRHFSFHTSCFGGEDEIRKVIDATVGLPITYEILAATPWTLHLLVAERYRTDRVFLAGDAGHLVIPAGGLGLNTGIGDATDLAWKLHAFLRGWGGPELLDSYEAERHPVGLRNREASRYCTNGQLAWRAAVRANIGDGSPEGIGTAAAVARIASVEQRKTHEMVGTELGYRYEKSPVICSEEGVWPPDVREVYIPTARPGARLPHMWLEDGQALHDVLGSGYSLLRLGHDPVDTSALTDALASYGAPVLVHDFGQADLRRAFGASLLLVRPDLHVAWRGDSLPEDVAALAARVTGHGFGTTT